MEVKVILDWRTVVALGASIIGAILATKMEADSAETVSVRVIDAVKEFAVACQSDR